MLYLFLVLNALLMHHCSLEFQGIPEELVIVI